MDCLTRLVQLAGAAALITGIVLLAVALFGFVLTFLAGLVLAVGWGLVIWLQERRPGGFADPREETT